MSATLTTTPIEQYLNHPPEVFRLLCELENGECDPVWLDSYTKWFHGTKIEMIPFMRAVGKDKDEITFAACPQVTRAESADGNNTYMEYYSGVKFTYTLTHPNRDPTTTCGLNIALITVWSNTHPRVSVIFVG